MISLLLGLLAQAPASAPITALSDLHRRDISCAAAFAIVASEQDRGVESALAYPPLGVRGQQFFIDVGDRVMRETGLDREAVRDLLVEAAAALQRQAVEAHDPNAALDAVMTPCLKRLVEVQGETATPDITECAAILAIARDALEAREGQSPAAKDMATLASVLESRARDELRAAGLSGNEQDQRLVETREKLEAAGEDQRSDLDYAACFELAAP